MAKEKLELTFKRRTIGMLLCYIVFVTLYMLAQYYAISRDMQWSYVLKIDHHIPFLEWLIIPYATSALFFVLVFYWVQTKAEYKLLVKRMLWVTVSAFIGFILVPIQFTFQRPDISFLFTKPVFAFIQAWDTSYNQAPSLHVAYAIIFWSVARKRFTSLTKTFIGIWLFLVIISTAFVYQHHTTDILSAIFLCLIIFYLNPDQENTLYKNIKIGLVFLAFGTFSLYFTFLFLNMWSYLLVWICITLFYVGSSYITNNNYFIKNKKGHIPLWKSILFFPYILTYQILWLFNSYYKPVKVTELLSGFFIGPYLSNNQAKKEFNNKKVIVFDLCTEIAENKLFKNNCTYIFYPLLDIATTDIVSLNHIVDNILNYYIHKDTNQIIYLHCAMGYSRSMLIATKVYQKVTNCSEQEAKDHVCQQNKNAIIKGYL